MSAIPSPSLERLDWPLAAASGVDVWVLRLDQIHQGWSGNKWYKLYGHLSAFASTHNTTTSLRADIHNDTPLVSCGGGYSNHLHALAFLGKSLGIPTVGVVRGVYPQLTPTLQDCQNWGMRLLFSSRKQWAQKHSPKQFLSSLSDDLDVDNLCWIPEGGGGLEGITGCRLIGTSLEDQVQQRRREKVFTESITPVYLACGTGTTATGLIAGLDASFRVEGISVLKGEDQLTPEISFALGSLNLAASSCRQWCIHTEFHGGGYGKASAELKDFARQFEQETHLLLDPIYTLKAFWALSIHLQQNKWPSGSQVVVVHTGGLQGRRGVHWM